MEQPKITKEDVLTILNGLDTDTNERCAHSALVLKATIRGYSEDTGDDRFDSLVEPFIDARIAKFHLKADITDPNTTVYDIACKVYRVNENAECYYQEDNGELADITQSRFRDTIDAIHTGLVWESFSNNKTSDMESEYSETFVRIPTDMYDILKEYYRHRTHEEPGEGNIDNLTVAVLSDFINALEGEFSSPKLRAMYDKYLVKHGK